MRTRALWLAAMLLAAAVAPFAHAQDPRTTIVQRVAREWVERIDRGQYDESWKAAGTKFRAEMTAANWAVALKRRREPLGALVRRSAVRTTFTRKFAGAPDGYYALVLFRTSFAHRSDGGETVTLEYEPDGAWRVIGYVIR